MKLKKIASLMLAGVMAVSMLAGCNTTGNQPEDPTDPIEPGTNGISANVGIRAEDFLGSDPGDIPEYVSFQDSSDLDDDLQYAVEYAGVENVLIDYLQSNVLVQVAPNIVTRLKDAVGVTGNETIWEIGSNVSLEDAEKGNGYTLDDAVAVQMFAVSSAIGENDVNQMVAEAIAKTVSNYKYSIESMNGGNYNHEYTVSISTYTKAVNSSIVGGGVGGTGVVGGAADPAVTFVAIQVVRTSTHQ